MASRDPVGRALTLLALFADHAEGPWGIRDVARTLGTSPSTVYRLFQVFESYSLIARHSDGKYVPGLELYRIGQRVARALSPIAIARPTLEWLSGECHEAVLLAAYDYRKGAMMFVDVIQAPHPLQWSVDLNEWMPVHSGATGRAILSFLPKEERERIYAGQLDQVTSRTVTQADRLEELVAETLRDGYALSSGERVIGAVGIGAPVFDSEGYVFGDVCITIPEGRFSEENVTRLTTSLKMAAEKISTALRRSGFLAPRRIDAHSEP